jgi:multisubunit Na+/H+ antiporter MnhC subunit
MKKVAEKETNIQKRNFFDYLTEAIGWVQIVISLLVLAGIFGALVYFSSPSLTRLIIGIGITITGLIAGIILATKMWKTRGTINFISRVSASPELDNIDEK